MFSALDHIEIVFVNLLFSKIENKTQYLNYTIHQYKENEFTCAVIYQKKEHYRKICNAELNIDGIKRVIK